MDYTGTGNIFKTYNKVMYLQKGAKAPQAAGRIHTDFEKGFIMAEVMKYADLREAGSEAAVKVHRMQYDF